MKQQLSKNVQLVMEILNDEVIGNTTSALKKLHNDYTMTWVYKNNKGKLFPSFKKPTRTNMKDAYAIKDRHYDIKNIAEGKNIVMIELVESYSNPDTHKKYRTPLVLILHLKNGKIITGRHYCDPNISYLHLSKKQIDKAFK